jgi:RimJ/RimL family protein N-acetyltransferase
MSDAVNTLLHEWAIPRMGVRKMLGTAFEGNVGSARVLQNAGMKYRETHKDIGEIKGIMRSLEIYDAIYTP